MGRWVLPGPRSCGHQYQRATMLEFVIIGLGLKVSRTWCPHDIQIHGQEVDDVCQSAPHTRNAASWVVTCPQEWIGKSCVLPDALSFGVLHSKV